MDLFYFLSKVFWFFASPDHLLISCVLLGTLLCFFKPKLAKCLLSFTSLALLLIMLFPLGDLLMRPLESRFPASEQLPEDIEGVIVLGGGERADLSLVWGVAQFNQSAERMMALPFLAKRYPEAKMLFTGGSGSLIYPAEVADKAMHQWFEDQAIGERVEWEKRSRNTFENALYSGQLLGGVPSGKWLLVTSAFHMPRSVGIFRKQGWQVVAYPVDYYSQTANAARLEPRYWRHIRDLGVATKEWIGLLAYYLTDKTDVLFPAPSRAPSES